MQTLAPHSGNCVPRLRCGRALDKPEFQTVRQTMELRYCKWDVQVGDLTALAAFPLLITQATWRKLAGWAELLTAETLRAERAILARPTLHQPLGLPRALRPLFHRGAAVALPPAAARVMRFDFHPTPEGWRISEVNSDVPGGYTEATHFATLMAAHYPGTRLTGDPTARVVDALTQAAAPIGTVALLCAPGHMEDLQLVTHIARHLQARGVKAYLSAPHHLRWSLGQAQLVSAAYTGPVGAVFRFYQSEWLARLPQRETWEPLFTGGFTPVANPGVAVLSESKRLPLVWDQLELPMPTWRSLLPETRSPGDVAWHREDGWVLKAAYSNTGDSVFTRASVTAKQWTGLRWRLRLQPNQWAAQRQFEVVPVASPTGPLFPCIGVYTVDGRAAGVYGRVAAAPIINFTATDIAVLIDEDSDEDS